MTKVLEDVGCFWNLWRGYSNVVQDLTQGDDGRSKHGFPKIFDLNLPVLHAHDGTVALWLRKVTVNLSFMKGAHGENMRKLNKIMNNKRFAQKGVPLCLVGGFNPSETYYCNQLGWLFPAYGKIKKVPNHQPACSIIAWAQDYVSICLRKREDPELLASHLLLWGYGVKELYNISLNPPKKNWQLLSINTCK